MSITPLQLAVPGILAFIISVIMTIVVRRWALKVGFSDQPGERKIHRDPIALGGGIVIYWVTILPLLVVSVCGLIWSKGAVPQFLPQEVAEHIPGLASRAGQTLMLVLAATVLHIMGLIDDRKHLGPFIKLFIQLAVAIFIALFAGIRFDFFIANAFVSTALSVIWIIVIMNAFNFLDNMDGLSAGIAAICGGIILGAAYGSGQVFVSAFIVIVIGTLCGFLIFNFNPAKIFMGDAGSLLVGLYMAVASIRTTYHHGDIDSSPWFMTLMPVIILAVPLYDFISVTILRLLQGKSPFVGDTQHFSHRLVKRGMSQKQAVLTIYLATASCGMGAMIMHQVTTIGMIMIFAQTLMVVLIIAILEEPFKGRDDK